MASAGIRKAALLLMGLDPPTAAELLKSVSPELVTRIAAELAYLEASGHADRTAAQEPIREFFQELRRNKQTGRGQQFIEEMLQGVLGRDKAREVMEKIPQLVDQRDPFLAIRSAEVEDIAEALKGESPHVAGMVLSELPPKKSAKLLSLLDEAVRTEAVRGMTREEPVAWETRVRVAAVVRRRLEKSAEAPGGTKAARQQQLRKVAIVLRDLGGELRSALIQAIADVDQQTSIEVQKLMVMWEDVKHVADRSLQEALRAVDSRKLALALVDADETTAEKLRSNMSQRQTAMLEEEASLLAKPKPEEIEEARGEFLEALRDLAANNFLSFDDDE
ncbi:MAG: hypothetical protein J7M21_03700 [Planctomycetes bacterium]|nr:hypothetical protein [Planctomycetota bacterium]